MIFGIGLGRTGTTSLAKALTILGYKGVDYPNPKQIKKLISNKTYDFGTDLPFSTHFKFFDNTFPKSKFILTIRPNIQEWLESVKYKHNDPPLDKMADWEKAYRFNMYRRYDYNEYNQIETLARHYLDILNHFKLRMNDLLIYNIVDGDGWKPLCNFLKKPIPKEKFPKLNSLKGK
jgi:hypothetical protein